MFSKARLLGFFLPLSLLLSPAVLGQTAGLYGKSYALVIGVDEYPHPEWSKLPFARKDGEAMAQLLRSQGFNEVLTLYDQQAIRTAIISTLEDQIAPKLQDQDRVVVFFSGHGATQHIAGKSYGYLVPHDGESSPSTWLSMTTLREISEKLGTAKHQLFILDACFGGSIGRKGSTITLAQSYPDYIKEVARRPSRQFLTAGGDDQKVLAVGPHGYSFFTGYLLEALEQGFGELNGDGYITALELAQYLQMRAANDDQTPGFGDLPGHGLGTFLFDSPGHIQSRQQHSSPHVAPQIGTLGLKGAVELVPIEEEQLITREARLREAPSPAASMIVRLAPGTRIWIAGQVQGAEWLLVEYGSQSGYLLAEAIQPHQDNERAGRKLDPQTPKLGSTIPWLGIQYQDITAEVRNKYGLPTNQTGVRVTHVEQTSPFRGQGLRVGDIITEVHARRVANVADFEAEVTAGRSGTSLRFWVERHNPRMPQPHYSFIFVQVP